VVKFAGITDFIIFMAGGVYHFQLRVAFWVIDGYYRALKRPRIKCFIVRNAYSQDSVFPVVSGKTFCHYMSAASDTKSRLTYALKVACDR